MTDEFVKEIIKEFNSTSVVSLEFSRGDSCISLKKAEACVSNVANIACKEINNTSNNDIEKKAESESNVTEKKAATTKAEKKETSTYTDDSLETIKSPIVGTFYRSPSPDSPAYAEPGKKIKKGDALCVLEAMKMMNTLQSDLDCEVVEVLVSNGDLVEYDQPLFKVRKLSA